MSEHRDDPQHLEARIRELEAQLEATNRKWEAAGDRLIVRAQKAEAQVEGCRGALEEIAAEEFKGPLGISIYQAAANELSRIKAVARQALALLKEPGNGK